MVGGAFQDRRASVGNPDLALSYLCDGLRPAFDGWTRPPPSVVRDYLPARLCHRVAFNIFLCFFLRMRLRRFLISDPMSCGRLVVPGPGPPGDQVNRYHRGMSYRIISLDHVQLAMPAGQEAVAERFYSGLLGLDRRPKPEPLASRGGCWFSNGKVVIHLGVEQDFRPAKKAHPALLVDDLDALTERLVAEGLVVRPDTELPGIRRGYVEDPFGNRIELIAAD
jgi:predicted enzyme related to lactoylglutathione lyase